MSFLEFGGQRHALPVGESVLGSDASAIVPLEGDEVLPQHAVMQVDPDGQVTIRRAQESAEVMVNGVRLGPNPTPLLHGDKVTVGGQELSFIDERKSGSTQYVQAFDPAMLAGMRKPSSKKQKPTAGTGGRLVSLNDGREYQIVGANFLIGRDASCDVVVTSKSVSRRHADIMTTPKGYVVVDSSTNGTVVNGKRVEGQQLLARGDMIQCGDHEFRFYADLVTEPEAAPTPPALEPGADAAPAPAAPETPAPPRIAPAPGAEHRLANTLHGVPSTPSTPGGEAPPSGPRTGEPMATRKPVYSGKAGPLANIIVRTGPLRGQRFALRTAVVNVGRADYNDVVIPEGSVSTNHAKIQRREGIWILVDLDSTNGTMVDGERVFDGEVPLAPGALLRFGDVQCVFEPTDDSIDAPKGSSTVLISSMKVRDVPGRGGS